MTGLAIRLRYWMRFLARISYRTDLPLVIHALRHRRYYALPADLWDLIEPLPGFLNASEAGLLYWAAHHWPVPGSVIELGSFGGRSTIVLASSGRHVHAVDAWGADSVHDPALKDVNLSAMFEQFQANVRRAGIESQVTAHRGSTWDVARDWHTPGALLFVDAGHEYAMVKGDLERWCPHLMPGGLLLMHDALGDSFLGVTRAAAELLQQGWVVTACAGCLVALVRK